MTITLPPWTIYAAFFAAGHLSAWVLILAFALASTRRKPGRK